MASTSIACLANRGRAACSATSTVIHVLRLVQQGYVSGSGPVEARRSYSTGQGKASSSLAQPSHVPQKRQVSPAARGSGSAKTRRSHGTTQERDFMSTSASQKRHASSATRISASAKMRSDVTPQRRDHSPISVAQKRHASTAARNERYSRDDDRFETFIDNCLRSPQARDRPIIRPVEVESGLTPRKSARDTAISYQYTLEDQPVEEEEETDQSFFAQPGQDHIPRRPDSPYQQSLWRKQLSAPRPKPVEGSSEDVDREIDLLLTTPIIRPKPTEPRPKRYETVGISPAHATMIENAMGADPPLWDKRLYLSRKEQEDDWRDLPEQFVTLLSTQDRTPGAAQYFRNLFRSENLDPKRLAKRSAIGGMVDLFYHTGVHRDWIWLAETLAGVAQDVRYTEDRFEPDVLPLLYSACGFALSRAAEGFAPSDPQREQHQKLALNCTDIAEDIRASCSWKLKGISWEYSMRGIVRATMKRWMPARDDITKSIQFSMRRSRTEYLDFDLCILREYRDMLVTESRIEDMGWIGLDTTMDIKTTLHHPERSGIPEFCEIMLSSFASIPNCGKWYRAKVDRESSKPNTENPTMIFGGLLLLAHSRYHSRLEESLQLYKRVKEFRIPIPYEVPAYLFRHMDKAGMGRDAIKIYEEMSNNGASISHLATRRILQVFINLGMMYQAGQVQQHMISKWPASTGDMMIIAQAYARRGHVQATVAALGDILHPRDICRRIDCLTVINKALIAADNSAGAEEVLTQIAKFGHDAQPYLDLLKMYSMKSDLVNAIRMFDEILKKSDTPHPDAFVMLIELFGRRGDLANAQRVYSSMVNNAIEPNPKVIAALINAEVDADEGVSAARRFKKCSSETQTHPAVVAAVLRAFVKTKVPTDVALTVFRRCTKLDNRHWSMIILSACDSVQLDLARKLMYEMDIRSRTDVDSPAPDIYTFSTFMYGYLRVKEDGKARQVYDEMVRRKIVPTSVTYAMIVQSFLGDPRHGQSSLDQAHAFSMATLEKAKMGALPDTFKNKSETPHRLLSPLMVAAGRARQPEVAQNYFNLAVEDNQPTVPLLSSLMQAYRLAEDLPSVLDLWKEIFALARENLLSDDRDEGQTRSNELCVPLSIVLDALSAHGMYQEVKDTWKSVREAGFGFDATNYNSLAIALARTGDVEGACQVLNTIILPRWTKVQKVRRDLWNLQGQVKRMAQDRTNVKPRSHRTPQARNVLNEHPRDVIAALGPDSDDIFQSRLDFNPISEVKSTEREYSLPKELEVEYARGSIVSPVRTATRRAQNRQDIPESDRRKMRGGLDHVISKLLAYWRPDDLHWKPTILLMDLFAHIFGQLERAEDAYRRGLRQQRQIAKWKVARTEAFRRARGNKNRVPNYLRRQSPRHKVAKLPRKVRLEELVVQEKPTKVTYGESIHDRRKPSRRVPGTPNQRPESLDSRIRPQKSGVTLIAGFTDIPIRDVRGEAAVSTPTALLRRLMRKYPHAVEYIMVYRAVAAEKERLRKLDELKDLMIIERQILKRRRALVRSCLLDLRSPEGIAAEHKSDIKAQRFRRDLIRLAKPPPIYLPAHIRQSHVSAERLEQAETFEIRGLFPVSQDPINIHQLKDEFLSQGGGWAWRQRLRELRRLRHERFRYKELQARKREAVREQRRLSRQKQLPRKVEHKQRSPMAKPRAQQEREKEVVVGKGEKRGRETRGEATRRATVKTSAATPLRLAESKSPHRREAKQGGSEEQRRSKLKTLAKVLDEANEKSFFDGFDQASTGAEGGGTEKRKQRK